MVATRGEIDVALWSCGDAVQGVAVGLDIELLGPDDVAIAFVLAHEDVRPSNDRRGDLSVGRAGHVDRFVRAHAGGHLGLVARTVAREGPTPHLVTIEAQAAHVDLAFVYLPVDLGVGDPGHEQRVLAEQGEAADVGEGAGRGRQQKLVLALERDRVESEPVVCVLASGPETVGVHCQCRGYVESARVDEPKRLRWRALRVLATRARGRLHLGQAAHGDGLAVPLVHLVRESAGFAIDTEVVVDGRAVLLHPRSWRAFVEAPGDAALSVRKRRLAIPLPGRADPETDSDRAAGATGRPAGATAEAPACGRPSVAERPSATE